LLPQYQEYLFPVVCRELFQWWIKKLKTWVGDCVIMVFDFMKKWFLKKLKPKILIVMNISMKLIMLLLLSIFGSSYLIHLDPLEEKEFLNFTGCSLKFHPRM
jgi:hypothetical protein